MQSPPVPHDADTASKADARFGGRAALAAVALALVAVPFALLLLSVEDRWAPLLAADGDGRDVLHRYALTHPGFVTLMRGISDSGAPVTWVIVITALVLWLLWRRLPRVATFVAVTGLGSSLLNTVVKTVVHRARPVVTNPVAHENGYGFPSGHAQGAVVGYALLLLLFLPMLRGVWRRVAVALSVVMVLAIGFSRVALAAHFVSDVLAGYVLGAAWVAAMTAVFSTWRQERAREARRDGARQRSR